MKEQFYIIYSVLSIYTLYIDITIIIINLSEALNSLLFIMPFSKVVVLF
jgi:hypothetical protein